MATIPQAKEEGDRHYRSGSFQRAVECYSQAIATLSQREGAAGDSVLYVCYSNRCACFLQMDRFEEALYDARQCIALKADWPKGYLRLASSYRGLQREDDAMAAYQQVLALDPNNAEARRGLAQLHQGGGGGGDGGDGASRAGYRPAGSFATSLFHSVQQAWAGIPWNRLTTSAKEMWNSLYRSLWSFWVSLDMQTQQIVQVVGGLLLVYYLLSCFSVSYDYYYDDPYYSSSYYYGGGGGLSWTTWGLVMFAAYKLPPLFPDQLGQYAQPFFGMNWTTFMWLLNLLTQQRRPLPRRGFYGARPAFPFSRY